MALHDGREWRRPRDHAGWCGGAQLLSLAVSNASYPGREVSWNAQSGSVRGALPAEYTFRLERGNAIAGMFTMNEETRWQE